MSQSLCGIGTALPDVRIAQADAAEVAKGLIFQASEQRLLPALYRRTTVRWRHSVVLESETGPLDQRQSFYPPAAQKGDPGPTTGARMKRYERDAGALAAIASRRALSDAGIAPEEISHLVTVSCSGFCAPGFDVSLFRDLPLGPDTSRTHLGFMGCHGALNALRVAGALSAANHRQHVLVCCVELCSLHYQYGSDPEQIVANALFADGAAAVVCSAQHPTDKCVCHVEAHGSTIVPETTDAMGWRIRDHGFEMNLSPRVPELIHRHLRPWLAGWLQANDVELRQVRSWAIHPGGPRIVSACGEALELDREALGDSLGVLTDYGNMSSPTVLFILDRLRQRNAPSPCVMLGFGPGLTIEAALVRW